jgi:hypothetical protein
VRFRDVSDFHDSDLGGTLSAAIADKPLRNGLVIGPAEKGYRKVYQLWPKWRRSPGGNAPGEQKGRGVSLIANEIHSSISIDQISAVRLQTGWEVVTPRTFVIRWRRDKGLMYHVWLIVVTGTTSSSD